MTQRVDDALLVLGVSEEIILLQCDFHVLSYSGFPCMLLSSGVSCSLICRHVVTNKNDDSVSVLLVT